MKEKMALQAIDALPLVILLVIFRLTDKITSSNHHSTRILLFHAKNRKYILPNVKVNVKVFSEALFFMFLSYFPKLKA